MRILSLNRITQGVEEEVLSESVEKLLAKDLVGAFRIVGESKSVVCVLLSIIYRVFQLLEQDQYLTCRAACRTTW